MDRRVSESGLNGCTEGCLKVVLMAGWNGIWKLVLMDGWMEGCLKAVLMDGGNGV